MIWWSVGHKILQREIVVDGRACARVVSAMGLTRQPAACSPIGRGTSSASQIFFLRSIRARAVLFKTTPPLTYDAAARRQQPGGHTRPTVHHPSSVLRTDRRPLRAWPLGSSKLRSVLLGFWPWRLHHQRQPTALSYLLTLATVKWADEHVLR